jgi:hypothetical protein
MTYKSEVQNKNLAWFLPRPKLDHYTGGMPLHGELWCLQLAKDILGNQDAEILNLFCGMNKYGFRVDIKSEVNPDLVCDAHELTKYLNRQFDIILADPPYSNKEAQELYGTPPLHYKKWTSECTKLLRPGGLLIVYHKLMMPNPSPKEYVVVKRVFFAIRTWHLPRIAIYFQKVGVDNSTDKK